MLEVVDLLNKYGIPYEDMRTSVKVKCLNPNHKDKHPSMNIRKDNGLFHCWSCGYKGNLFTLNKLLGEKTNKNNNYFFNMPIIRDVKKEIEYDEPRVIGKLKSPFDDTKVLDFLHSIGYCDKFINAYDVKYTNYCEMIANKLYDDPDEKFTSMEYRIVIPIKHNGKIINYECRTFVNAEPKIKYVKGCSVQTIFNWDNIDKNKMVVITESNKNLAKIWQVYPNVISIFHNILTEKQIEMINELDDICLALDNDEGGFGKIENGKVVRDGMLQSFLKNYDKPFKIMYDSRIHVKNGKRKGYDMNDCTLDEIRKHILNAKLYEKFNKKITW